MIRIHQRHRVVIDNHQRHRFTDYPELTALGKWLATDGPSWSCLSLQTAEQFRTSFTKITGLNDVAVHGSH